jgi:hypothetical protein
MGSITIYSVAHGGTGAFENKHFKTALQNATSVDIESSTPVSRKFREKAKRIANGDIRLHNEMQSVAAKKYQETKNPQHLFSKDLFSALFNSRKKVTFEKPPKDESVYFGKIHSLFPHLRNASNVFAPYEEKYPNCGFYVDMLYSALARSMHDSKRLAAVIEKKPDENILVIRGFHHSPTAEFLKEEIAKRGLNKIEVNEIPMPRSRIESEGTPYQASPSSIILDKLRRGRPVTELDVARGEIEEHIGTLLSKRRWGVPNVESQTAFISNILGKATIDKILQKPEQAFSIIKKEAGVDLYKPWWKKA